MLDLGPGTRQNPPVVIAGVGPVIDLPTPLHEARALNDRRAARDYLDIHVLLSRTPWTPARLFAALRDHLRPTITCDPRSPPQSSRQTWQLRANRNPRITMPTG